MTYRSWTIATIEPYTLYWVLCVEVSQVLNAIGLYGLYVRLTDVNDNGDGTVTIIADVHVADGTNETDLQNSIFTAIQENVSSTITVYGTMLYRIYPIPVEPSLFVLDIDGGSINPGDYDYNPEVK